MNAATPTSAPLQSAGARLAAVRHACDRAAAESGRKGGDVTLICVSKTFGSEEIAPVLEAGHRVFGENRVQEASGKWPALQERFGGVSLHLIGPLQSNKVREAVALFDVIHTLDRPSLAEALAREIDRTGRKPELFIQVNTGEEPQKAGVTPADADDFIARCRGEFGLEIIGLMCIPPVQDPPSPHFALLGKIAARNGLSRLSMGMSGDFEQAIMLGATHVRVGSAIFGSRA
ncbi:YggS family pyridoxal phosphate enzyme [Camelimonas fluminis]|uniref:Pyridoxal phosphate homeostasis protein n=1 Tax=Camelimonas fluminis TaxID=1576911 RepID=A0ABV7UK82_9HYPH|nr:YggS family pyridoxal phosphate-dependent enzyme [Camelimonas fluminis]GHE54801.1 YggS family pyridoxal phosphate enzyme [Camelimonas fluminis]